MNELYSQIALLILWSLILTIFFYKMVKELERKKQETEIKRKQYFPALLFAGELLLADEDSVHREYQRYSRFKQNFSHWFTITALTNQVALTPEGEKQFFDYLDNFEFLMQRHFKAEEFEKLMELLYQNGYRKSVPTDNVL